MRVVLTTGLTKYGKGDYSPCNAAANYGQVSRAKIIDEKADQGAHTGADDGHHDSLGHNPMVANSQWPLNFSRLEPIVPQGRVMTPRAHMDDWQSLLIGESWEMRQVHRTIELAGQRRATVLITGESGTGKERAARALHLASPRCRASWVAVNCTALPENLLEAELFGHTRGAFTGAMQSRVGRFEQANNGTLFLDEIGDLPLDLQGKLLRVLQEREFQRLGSSETVQIDVRVIAATNCDLMVRIEEGRFREDLYYRLSVVPLAMPALRQRRLDIPMLAGHFSAKICEMEGVALKSIEPEALEKLCAYDWPGNVRQLENAIEAAVALSGDRRTLTTSDFPLPTVKPTPIEANGIPTIALPDNGLDYDQTLAFIERSILQQALKRTGGNKKAAADMLHLKRTTLSAKVRTLATRYCA